MNADDRFRNLRRSLDADPDFLQLRRILATAYGTICAWRPARPGVAASGEFFN